MPPFARVIPWLVLAFALVALVMGLYEWSHPPFSDEQLRTSTTDTWEVAASTTRVFAIVFLGLGAVCVALARKFSGAPRVVAGLAAIACLVTLAVIMHNHVELTQRVAVLTGMEFGVFYGLL